MVAIVRAQGGKDYYLHGFANLNDDIRKQLVVAGMVAYVPERGLKAVLTDDRLASYAKDMWADIVGELGWLEAVAPPVWARLATLAGGVCEDYKLSDDISHACHVALAVCNDSVFRVLDNYPWGLVTEGNIVDTCVSPRRQR